MHRELRNLFFTGIFLSLTATVSAQDLDPRSYARVPVDMTVLVAGFSHTYGGVVSDLTSPLQDVEAKIESPLLAVAHTFSLFGLTSQALVALPFSWAQASGKVGGEARSITRSGLGDTRLRISALFVGAPAASAEEFAKYSSQVVLGTSLTIVAPTGQYFSEKLINLGANRWSVKPEIGLSYRLTQQWLIDLYAGVWLFTNNESFYPGTSVRSQDPLTSFQTHLSYNLTPLMWAAIDFTYYVGGQSSIDDVYRDDRQNNSRLGATFNFQVSKLNSMKFAYSTGAIIRVGANFSTISIAWQTVFF